MPDGVQRILRQALFIEWQGVITCIKPEPGNASCALPCRMDRSINYAAGSRANLASYAIAINVTDYRIVRSD